MLINCHHNRKFFSSRVSVVHEYKQYCHVGNTAKQCRLGLFQDSDFTGDIEDSKSTSGGTLCIFGSHTFVPISWMCKKQTAVSHSSTESEIISLDTGLRLDGLPALELWDLIFSVFRSVFQVSDRSGQPDNDVKKHQKSRGKITVMENIDSVLSNVQSSRQEALLYVFEDNEAVIKVIIKGRSPTMRHVSRTHRFALDWLFDRIYWTPRSKSNMLTRKTQLADMLTKGSFARDEWDHLLRLLNILNFSMFSCTHRKQSVMSKRAQESTSEEGSAVLKPRPMNLVSRNRLSEMKTPPQDSSASNSPVNQELDQIYVSLCARKLMRNSKQDPTACSQERRQDDTLSSSTRKLERGDDIQVFDC